ncbi:MAG: hypothetical protein UDG86_08860 [Lachnospiraceae bacterium]|jgi:hypothetical protein|nr:hypothetical protein [Lachnospiraceae bacterium]
MKHTRKLLILFSTLVLALGFTLTARAKSPMRFSKEIYVMTEGRNGTLTLINSDSRPEFLYDSELFTSTVLSNTKIRVTAKKPGIEYINVRSGLRTASCRLVIMPKANPAIKKKAVRNGTRITYKKISLTLPKVWKKNAYVILTGKNYISFHAKGSYKTGYYGKVFDVSWCSVKQWRQLKNYLPNYTYLKKRGSRVYYLTLPSDVQFNTESRKLMKQYSSLSNSVDTLKKSIKIR